MSDLLIPTLAASARGADPIHTSLSPPQPLATSKDSTAGRWDIYGPVHKGLRRAHGALLERLGRTDWAGEEVVELPAELRAHLRLAAKHLAHEDAFIHPALAARVRSASDALDEQHEHHRARLGVLEARIAAYEAASHEDRASFGRELYLAFSEFVAEDLAHMFHEEAVVWPVLCATFSDAELQAMEMEIIAALSPDEVIAFMRLMIPAMNHPERVGLLGGMKANAPPEAYAAVMDLGARSTLGAPDFRRLESALRGA